MNQNSKLYTWAVTGPSGKEYKIQAESKWAAINQAIKLDEIHAPSLFAGSQFAGTSVKQYKAKFLG